MENYEKIRQDNIDVVDNTLKDFINEKELKGVIFFIQAESNRVLIGYNKKIENKVTESKLEYHYSRKFYMPFDNLDVCKKILLGDIFDVLMALKYDKFNEI